MVQVTIREVIKSQEILDTQKQYIYIYRDGDCVFYVGRTNDPLQRLFEHLGKAPRAYLPDALG